MEQQFEYEIFISCNSKDYKYGRDLYDFLQKNDIKSFLADKELRKLGIADYGKAIDKALEQSKHLVVVTSSVSNVEEATSPYVYYEWHTFSEEKKSGRKDGNIMTIVTNKDITKKLPIALRNTESFLYNDHERILDYLKKAPQGTSSLSNTGSGNMPNQTAPPINNGPTTSDDPNPSSSGGHKDWRKWLLWALLLALPIAALGFYAWNQKNRPLILFAGGGSAANFIKALTKDKIDVNDYPNSIYLNLPSEAAWTILAEEVNRTGTGNPFISICVSADRIDPAFTDSEKTRNLFQNASIIGYYLGEDSLLVYVRSDLASKWKTDNDTITAEELVKQIDNITTNDSIKNETIARIFTTSKDSGTLRAYQRCISKSSFTSSIDLNQMLDSCKTYIYISNSSNEFYNNLNNPENNHSNNVLPFVILGSKYYTPKDLKPNHRVLFVKLKNIIVSKPMYVYFLAYNNHNNDYCTVRRPIIRFLKTLKNYKPISEEKWNMILNDTLRHEKGMHLFYLNEE